MLKGFLSLVPLLFLLGSGLLLFFINLAGSTTGSPLSNFYWSQADTLGIPGARHAVTRWTPYSTCGVRDGKNYDCTKHSPAYPYSPSDNFGETDQIPKNFSDSRDTYYYLSRFAYAFFLVALVFNVIAIIGAFGAGCVYPLGILGSVLVGLSLLFTVTAACLITAAHVKGRHNFSKDGRQASLGVKLFAFAWTSVALLFISLVIIPILTRGNKRSSNTYNQEFDNEKGSITPSSHEDVSSFQRARETDE